MPFDFDRIVPRRGTGSAKWELYPADVLPMWVADMDLPSPEPVVRALQQRVAHGFFGYGTEPGWLSNEAVEGLAATVGLPPAFQLADVLVERMRRLYGWAITRDDIVFVPSLVTGINAVCRAVGRPGDSVLTITPTYPPFLSAPKNHDRVCDTLEIPLVQRDAHTIDYELDWDALDAAFHERTSLFLLSNPHNPIGRDYDRATLARMAEICIRHGAVICSDEIHCDLLLGGTSHTPMAAISPEIAEHTITLMAPSKTFNLPGLGCGFAIVTNPELRAQLKKACDGIVPHVNLLGFQGALAAFSEGGEWLDAVRAYLTANRDLFVSYVAEHLPTLRTTVPDSTYLAWVDCRAAGIEGSPGKFFLNEAKVALSDGAGFGPGGEGFVRVNFACPRPMLLDALERMRAALARLG